MALKLIKIKSKLRYYLLQFLKLIIFATIQKAHYLLKEKSVCQNAI